MSHTWGKLHVFDEYDHNISVCADNSYVCFMALEKENTREQALGDARRIVALWNAAADAAARAERDRQLALVIAALEEEENAETAA